MLPANSHASNLTAFAFRTRARHAARAEMPSLEDVTYNREECIAAVRDYYHFLTKLYLDESDIEEPPEDGWPNVTADTMGGLGKTDEVVQLLRHLPYIRGDERVQGGPWVEFANWRETAGEHGIVSDEEGESARVCSEPPEYVDNIPPQVISLTSNESELGGIFLFDTERGIVHWHGCYGELKGSEGAIEDDPYDWAPEDEAEWRAEAPAWAVSDFFELLKDQFRRLDFVPINSTTVHDVFIGSGPRREGYIALVQEIYRRHGWPDLERFRKTECLEAVRNTLEERFPDEFE